MGTKEIIKKWHNYFSANLERGNSWNKIRLDLILKHRYRASLIEKLIYNYRIESAIKQKQKQRLAVGIAASLLIIMFVLPFFIKPSILGMVPGGPAVTYYVDATNGDDSNDGLSPDTAIKTLAKVNTLRLYPGDSVLFKRGEIWREAWRYSGSSGTSEDLITFGAYGTGDKPKFYGSINGSSTSYWTSLGNNRWTTPADFPSETFMIFYNTNGDVQMGARRTTNATLTSNWDFWWTSSRIVVYHTSNPASAGNGIELPKYNTTFQTLVYFSSVDYIVFKDIEISYTRYRSLEDYSGNHNEFRNIDFKYGYEKALWLEGDNVIADNNSFYLCGIRGQPAPYGLDAQGENMWITQVDNPTITNNKIERCGGVCINFYHANGGEVRGNRIWNCQQSPADWSAGIYYDGCSNNVASYNNVTDCQVGLQVGAENSGTSSHNITFHHNIAYNNAISEIVLDSTQATIVNYDINISHNTFFRSVYVSGSGFGNDIFLKYYNNLIFKDNIIYNNYPNSTRGRLLYIYNGTSGTALNSDYNSWNSAIGRNIWQINGVKDYTSLEAWQSGQSQDVHSINADPLFTDAVNGDFRPQSGSPACTMSSTGSYVGALPCEGQTLPPTPFCGDSSCNGAENCSTCEADCGICPEEQQPSPICGDGSCNGLENCSTCSSDCGSCPIFPFCGDDSCNGLENCSLCSEDCGSCPIVPVCGDHSCNGQESCLSCPDDCGSCPVVPRCGDDSCNGLENCSTCSSDCGSCPLPEPFCGDSSCNGVENCTTCSSDCGTCSIIYYCGDNACNNNENCSSCASDCGSCPLPEPFCGDSSCNGLENCSTCEVDCGDCQIIIPPCGDGVCNGYENCSTCSDDCGSCPVKKKSSGGGRGGGSIRLTQTNTSSNTSSSNLIGKAANWVKETVKGAEEKVRQELGGEEETQPEAIITEPSQETPGEVEIGVSRKENPELFTSIMILVVIALIGVVTAFNNHYPKIKKTLISMRKSDKDDKAEPETQENQQKPKDLSISGLQNNNIEELAKLHKYVSEAANRGYSRERVKNELLGVGWEQHLVGILLSMHYSECTPEEIPESPLSQSAVSTQTRPQSPDTVNPNTGNSMNKWMKFEDIR